VSFEEDGRAALAWAERYLERVDDLPVLAQVEPGEIRSRLPASPPVEGEPSPLRADPARVRQACEAAVRALITLSTETPSQRLLADHTAAVLAGVSTGLNALALLVGHRAQPVPRRGIRTRRPIGCRLLSMRCVRSSPSAPSRDSPPISMEERRSGISH